MWGAGLLAMEAARSDRCSASRQSRASPLPQGRFTALADFHFFRNLGVYRCPYLIDTEAWRLLVGG